MENPDFTNSDLETVLARQLSWIQAADTRAGFILPLATSLLGVIAALTPKDMCSWEFTPIVFAVAASVFLIISLICVACASFPRTTGPEGSLIFFGGIASLKLDEYQSKINDLTVGDYRCDLIAQCHRNAQIADRKYIWVKRSLLCIFIALLPWVLAIFELISLGK